MPSNRVQATLNVLTGDEGGRTAPFNLGYRPQFHAAGSISDTSFIIEQIEGGRTQMAPGESALVVAYIMFPDEIGVPVVEGMTFELREGFTVVARARIIAFL